MKMPAPIGAVAALYRYPVKSMRGESLAAVELGWHGLDGDRRLAFRRPDDRAGFPWLTASKLPDLVRFAPGNADRDNRGSLPTHVRTPDGEVLPVFGQALAADVSRRHGSTVEMVHLNRGIFDEASVSVIAEATAAEIGRLAGTRADVRRFRPNIVLSSAEMTPFEEEAWVGGILQFGEGATAPLVAVTNYDVRCAMVNLDPDTAESAPAVLRSIVQSRNNRAGVYGAVIRSGRVEVGQSVFYLSATETRQPQQVP